MQAEVALPFEGGSSYGHDVLPDRPRASRALSRLFLFACVAGAIAGNGCGGEQSAGSMGAVLGRDNDTHALYVRDVPEGLGADLAGLLPGDEIVMIDGVYARDLDAREIGRRLRGDVGTTVELTLLRANEVRRVRVRRTPMRGRGEVQGKEERVEP